MSAGGTVAASAAVSDATILSLAKAGVLGSVLYAVASNKMPDGMHGSGDGGDNQYRDSKTLDDILNGTESGRITKGKTSQYIKTGSYKQTAADFDALNPTNVKEINTKFGSGKTGILSDGRTVTARPGSSDGRPTLEIRNANGRGIEIRYGK